MRSTRLPLVNHAMLLKGGMLAMTLALLGRAEVQAQLAVPYSATGTYTPPAGVTQVTAECWGGGGRGGSRTGIFNLGVAAGGGGGAYSSGTVTVTPLTSYTVTVGAGSNSASAGGDSWFSTATTVMAKGGNSAPNSGTVGAVGGAASSSFGTVKRNGGTGASAPGLTSGGGGSSAGPGSPGTAATGTAGAVAPSGGGNGGDARTGSNGNGTAGVVPGGGGGGALRLSGNFTDRNGGNGATGKVVVSMAYTAGTCLTTNGTYNAIPDNGCATGVNSTVGLAQSGLPTTLGTAAGNARLVSVELIVAGTFNADINVTLTSPAGTTRDMILGKFGNGDNLGNPGTCTSLVLVDGATALSNTNTSNVTGNWAPEQTLAGFTGDPNGTWTISFCDDAANDNHNIRMARLNFCTVPLITATSSNSPVCAGNTLSLGVTATGTGPLSYTWTGAGTYSPNNTTDNVTVTGPATGNYNIAVSSTCGSTNTNVAVTVNPAPSATISYTGSPYCSTGGTASVTRTGTAGGSYSSTAGLSINAGTGAVDLGASTPNTYTVTYTIAAAGGCALYQTTTSITVTAADTWYADSDADGFGDPAVTTLSCAAVPGYVLDNTDNCPSAFGLVGDACDDGNADTVGDLLLGDCSCAGTNTPWYSQGSGDHDDAIWSHSISGAGVTVSFSGTSIVVVQSGHALTVASALSVGELTVEGGASVLLGTNDLSVFGNTIVLDGDVESTTGELRFEPAAAATITGAGSIDVNDMSVDAAVSLSNAVTTDIRGTLLLENGAFTVSGGTRLVSNAAGTARLGPVGAGATYTGDLIVERYIPGGATNWRLLGSPVAGRTVFHWKDDFFMAGFTGSHYPNFYSGGVLWPSVRKYDETVSSADINAGLVGVTGITESLAVGRGYAAWSGDLSGGTAAFTVDVKGNPTIASTPIALPITYTNSGNAASDGWNLVSNPVASPIDFTQIVRGADVANQYWLFDPATGNNVTWSSGVGNGAANGIVQSGQGFWMKATGPSITTTVDESAKVLAATGGAFGGDQSNNLPILRLALTSSVNSFADEVAVVFDQGTPGFDPIDAQQFVFAHPQAPQMATRSADGVDLSIDFFGAYSEAITIPVTVNAAVTGNYTITAEMIGIHNLSCLSLEDLATGTITPLQDGADYSFVLDAAADETEPRFMIHGTAPLPLAVEHVACANEANGAAMVNVGNEPVTVTWMDANGGELLSQVAVVGEVMLADAAAGDYQVSISTGAACGTLVAEFTIEQPFEIQLDVEQVTATSCPNAADGTIAVNVLGGTSPYAYLWSNGSTAEVLVAGAGGHSLAITDANGCQIALEGVVIEAGEGPVAGIDVAAQAMVAEEVTFQSTSQQAETWYWEFGDGSTSVLETPVHSYGLPGTYEVALTVTGGDCSDRTTTSVEVEQTTGVVELTSNSLRAWAGADGFVVEHAFDRGNLMIDVLDATGRLVRTMTVPAMPGQVLVQAGLSAGIWNLRITHGGGQHTLRVPVLR